MLFSISKNVFRGAQKQKDKLIFRKIDIIPVWQIVSSVGQKQNPVDFNNSSWN